jgi:N-acetylglucosaminyldiphosphoundecaprenol N-acetyl-beta-D-mannosaminyltransferase
MKTIPKLPILGIGISAISNNELLEICRQWIDGRRCDATARVPLHAHSVLFCNVHSVVSGVFEPSFKAILNTADIAAPDGMPVAWALRSFGVRHQERVYGPDLMLALCEQSSQLGHRVFLYGGRPDTLSALTRKLKMHFPGLEIVGAYAPPFRPLTADEDARCVEAIGDSKADIVFVGLGMPKQERWIDAHRDQLPGVVLAGVGAAFDFFAGRVKQAPKWMQKAGLEWFFRLLIEPRRLWKRYVICNPLFILLWGMQRLGALRYDTQYERSK